MQSHRLRRVFHGVLDHPLYFVLLAIVVAFTVWAVQSRTQPYKIQAEFASAFNAVQGQPVDIYGVGAGMIDGLHYDKKIGSKNGGGVVVTIGIMDKQFTPLHKGTTVDLRWGSTIGNGTRRLDVNPGPQSAPLIKNGGIVPTHDTTAPVDVDQVQDIFTMKERGRLTGMLANVRAAIKGEPSNIKSAINSAPAALGAADNVFSDIRSENYALHGLISAGNSLTSTLAARAGTVSNLISSAGTTFTSLADNASGVQQTIQNLPGALSEARGTLQRVDHSVGIVNGLVNDIRPGAAKLTPLANQLEPTLLDLHSVVPNGVATLQTVTRSAPSINRLLKVATPVISNVGTDARQLAPMTACIIPYAPEAASALIGAGSWVQNYALQKQGSIPGITWHGATTANGLIEQHGLRAVPVVDTESAHIYPTTPEQYIKLFGKQYGLIRPPGYGVGQPQFNSSCGITPGVLNPANDPEAAK